MSHSNADPARNKRWEQEILVKMLRRDPPCRESRHAADVIEHLAAEVDRLEAENTEMRDRLKTAGKPFRVTR